MCCPVSQQQDPNIEMEEPYEKEDCAKGLFTPVGRPERVIAAFKADFSGFRADSVVAGDNLLWRRVIDLESQVRELMERLNASEHSVQVLRAENVAICNELSDLWKHAIVNEQKVEQNSDKVNQMDKKQNV